MRIHMGELVLPQMEEMEIIMIFGILWKLNGDSIWKFSHVSDMLIRILSEVIKAASDAESASFIV